MKKSLVLLSLLALLVLIPSSALAQTPVYYCTSLGTTDGDGSFENPWSCVNTTELNAVIAEICSETDYAILYQIVTNGYYRHVIEDPNDAACGVTSTVFYYGDPPDTGVTLPMPVLLGGLFALGAVLVGGGYMIYRKRATA